MRAGGGPGENCNGGCDWLELAAVWVRTVMVDVTGNPLGRGEMIHSWMGYKDAKEESRVSPEGFFVVVVFFFKPEQLEVRGSLPSGKGLKGLHFPQW